MINTPSNPTRRQLIRGAWFLVVGTSVGAVGLPLITATGPSARARQDVADPTKTREAELDELHTLRTQVAESNVCTPLATATKVSATASATVVPAEVVGVTISYADQFEIAVLGIAPLPAGGALVSQGQLLQVNLTLLNTTRAGVLPPFNSLLLIDASGQAYQVDRVASREIGGFGWDLKVAPGELASRSIVFDVLPNAGTTFTLESRDEPTFRVALAIESRG